MLSDHFSGFIFTNRKNNFTGICGKVTKYISIFIYMLVFIFIQFYHLLGLCNIRHQYLKGAIVNWLTCLPLNSVMIG
jgi:hypothetical protein